MMHQRRVLLCSIVLLDWISGSCAWIFKPLGSVRTSTSSLKAASDDETELQRKMALVRSIQMSFYKQNQASSTFDQMSGTIENLALWRVPWTELPGRSNVLNVHDPVYTNMFEEILYGAQPWYVGHLYLPNGSKNLKTEQEKFRLKTWKEEAEYYSTYESDEAEERTAVVGTLMSIADYRRMSDGRLLLLVQALERFVITDVKRDLPYSVADVQLLPDPEEIDPDAWIDQSSEGLVREARALALAESFQRFHRYEYDPQFKLPMPDKDSLSISDIYASSIAKVLPFVPFSKRVAVDDLYDEPIDIETAFSNMEDDQDNSDDDEICLEQQLIDGKILKEPTFPGTSDMEADYLEYKLWLAMNEYLKTTKTPVAPALLGLMPPQVSDWPSNFVLKRLADQLLSKHNLQHSYVPVSKEYPAYRRHRRLSFSAATLLEHKPGRENLRQSLLEIHSTKARLLRMLQLLEQENADGWGEFL